MLVLLKNNCRFVCSWQTKRQLSNGKRAAAAAGTARVRIRERKAPVVKPIPEIYFHAGQIKTVGLIEEHRDPFNVKFLVALFLPVKAQHVIHAGAAAALHADPQAMITFRLFFSQ